MAYDNEKEDGELDPDLAEELDDEELDEEDEDEDFLDEEDDEDENGSRDWI